CDSGLTASHGITGHAVNHSVVMNRPRVARDRMALMMRLCLFLLLFAPSFMAEESSFALWTPAAIGQREAALMKNVAPDHSSRETLADYGDHRVCCIATPTVSPKSTTRSSTSWWYTAAKAPSFWAGR